MANQKQKQKRLLWRKEQKATGIRPVRKSGRHGYTKKEWRDNDKPAPRTNADVDGSTEEQSV